MRHIPVVALTLALLLSVLPVGSVSAAEPDPSPERTLADAVVMSLDADAVMTHALGRTVDLATAQAGSYVRLNAAKAAQRELARQWRRDKRAVQQDVSGQERRCRLAALDRAYVEDRAQLEVAIVGHRAELGYINRQKAMTRIGDRIGRLARYVGGIVKEVVKEAGPELIGSVLGGPSVAVILKRKLSRVLKNRLANETLGRLVGHRSTGVLAQAEEACRETGEAREQVDGSAAPSVLPSSSPSTTTGSLIVSDFICHRECEHCATEPYDQPAVLIHFDWSDQADVRLNYWAAPPGAQPYSDASWSGGCADDPYEGCFPVEPLVLSQANASGKNLSYFPDRYELTVEAVPCLFSNDIPEKPGEEGPKHLDVCARIDSVGITATIAHYRAGERVPHKVESPLTVTAPLYPCDGYPDPAPFRRVMGAFDWDPAAGVASPVLSEAASSPASGSDEDAPWDSEES